MERNLELKARFISPELARSMAEAVSAQFVALEHQIDTYFHCRSGRLKLRQIVGQRAELIWYLRPDEAQPKPSTYRLVPVAEHDALREALAAGLGLRVVVDKKRQIYLLDYVRIHIDEVAGLGNFIEFEAVLAAGVDLAAARKRLNELVERFGIQTTDLVAGSYADALRRQA